MLVSHSMDAMPIATEDPWKGCAEKLTSIGEKKFAYILLRPGISEEEIGNISAHMESRFPCNGN